MNKIQGTILLNQGEFIWRKKKYKVLCNCNCPPSELGHWVDTDWEDIFGKFETPNHYFGMCHKCHNWKWIEEVK